MGARSHRELVVWQKAMDLAVEVYRLSALFPADERFRLVSQVTRAAASVPANIAEGRARLTRRDYAQFISIARGSLAEAETFLLLAVRLEYLALPEVQPALDLLNQVERMLAALRSRLLEPPRPS